MGPRIVRVAVVVGAALVWPAAAAPAAARAADRAVTFPTAAAAAPYTPSTVEAIAGDTVTFSGAFAAHPLVWDANEFDTRSTGTTAQFPFALPGSFRFHCQIHPSMVGTVHVVADQFATPEFTWGPAAPQAGQTVTFTAASFADPDGAIDHYEWDLDGDGSFESTGAQVARAYAAPGTVAVALRYVDDRRGTSPATVHAVAVGGAPAGGGSGAGGGTTTPSGDGGSGAAGAVPGVRLTTRALAFRRGAATVALSVAAPATARITLRRGATVLALGTARVGPGAGRVRVGLTRAGARRLGRTRTLRATLTAVLRQPAGHVATVRRTVTVRLAR